LILLLSSKPSVNQCEKTFPDAKKVCRKAGKVRKMEFAAEGYSISRSIVLYFFAIHSLSQGWDHFLLIFF